MSNHGHVNCFLNNIFVFLHLNYFKVNQSELLDARCTSKFQNGLKIYLFYQYCRLCDVSVMHTQKHRIDITCQGQFLWVVKNISIVQSYTWHCPLGGWELHFLGTELMLYIIVQVLSFLLLVLRQHCRLQSSSSKPL